MKTNKTKTNVHCCETDLESWTAFLGSLHRLPEGSLTGIPGYSFILYLGTLRPLHSGGHTHLVTGAQ